MQNTSTQIFIYASILFGIIGMLVVITAGGPDTPDTKTTHILMKLLFATIFVILPSFAISVANKYLSK